VFSVLQKFIMGAKEEEEVVEEEVVEEEVVEEEDYNLNKYTNIKYYYSKITEFYIIKNLAPS
jgi:hypothetical protein